MNLRNIASIRGWPQRFRKWFCLDDKIIRYLSCLGFINYWRYMGQQINCTMIILIKLAPTQFLILDAAIFALETERASDITAWY